MVDQIDKLTPKDLIAAVLGQDNGIIELLVTEYTSILMKAALGLGFTPDRAEDLVQNVWIIFFQNPEKFEGRSLLKTFLLGILYNKVRELRRELEKNKSEDRIEELLNACFDHKGHWSSHLASPEQILEASETLSLIEKCLHALPTSQRLAFYLREVEEYPSPEICKILEVTGTNLGVLLFRAKAGLRHCLEFKIRS